MFEFKMLPINTMNERKDSTSMDIVIPRQFKHPSLSIVEILKYLKCLLLSKFCHSCLLTYGSTFLSVAILLILFGSSQNQVIRVNTPGVITFVQNVEFSGVAFVHHVRNSAAKLVVTLNSNSCVSFILGCACPVPTIFGAVFVNPLPKSKSVTIGHFWEFLNWHWHKFA